VEKSQEYMRTSEPEEDIAYGGRGKIQCNFAFEGEI
jgi:hypothetical protein